jgi:hypothetical protein
MADKVPVAFVQLDSGTVYTVYDFPISKRPAPKPLSKGKGMTDEEIRDAHEAYLRHLAHDE